MRIIREGEVFTRKEVIDGLIQLPDPPPMRPEPPLDEQQEKWARIDQLHREHPIRRWVKERLRNGK